MLCAAYGAAPGALLVSQALQVLQRTPTDVPVSESGAVFPYELKPLVGLFHSLAVVTLAPLEASKCLLSPPGKLSGSILQQDNCALPDVPALASIYISSWLVFTHRSLL